jgi:pilus assembly protein Flp/PilA
MSKLMSFVRDQSGATAIEYCIIAGGISVAITAAVTSIGATVYTKFHSVSSLLQ